MKKGRGHFRQANEVDRGTYYSSDENVGYLATNKTNTLNKELDTLPRPTSIEGVLPPERYDIRDTKEEHTKYRRKAFSPKIDITYGFTEEERELLRKYGSWMNALENKDILPNTSEQVDFLNNIKNNVHSDDLSQYEKVWIKYKVRVND